MFGKIKCHAQLSEVRLKRGVKRNRRIRELKSMKERKKYGLKAARRAPQFSKR